MAQQGTPANVASAATQTSTGALGGLILLGTFGTERSQRALVRTSKGEVVELKVGDRIGRAPIIAIQDGRLAMNKNGQTAWLAQPVAN